MMNAMGKKLAYGVYIQDTTGKLWESGTWNGSATPNGVAVYDESCSFIIALEGDKQLPINDYSVVSTTLPAYDTQETAIADFDGAGNTGNLVRGFGAVATKSAGYCAAYTFPNGETGYLGSAGEWNVAFKYKDEIDAIMALLGEDALNISYWTSTYCGKRPARFWYFMWTDGANGQAGDMGNELVTSNTYYTRPFGVFDIKGVGGGSGTAKTRNKIQTKINVGGYQVESQYPVASDIQVTLSTFNGSITVTILEGQTKSERIANYVSSIVSVTPAEDDIYIYTF